jgi:cell division protein FtsQ
MTKNAFSADRNDDASMDMQLWVRRVKWIAAVLGCLLIAAAIAWGLRTLARLPIEQIVFVGDLKNEDRIDVAELELITRDVKAGVGFVDIQALQALFKRVPWVREVTVRRKFPNSLEVRLEAHRPLARWGESDLVNTMGDRFSASFSDPLPRLTGPEGSSQQVAQQFIEFQRLVQNSGSEIEEVRLTNRRAWQLKLKSGPMIELGRAEESARLVRALSLMEMLPQLSGVTQVDARYGQGLAVKR